MAGDSTAAFGVFANRVGAEAAVDRLTAAGFSSQYISLLISDKEGAEESATTAVGVGGVVGGTLGLLAGIGAWAIPDVGPFIAAGPIMASLAGLSVGGAVGGLVGALVGLGIPEYEAKVYDGRVKDGGVLLSVHCVGDEEVSKARAVLTAVGAEDIASSGEDSIDIEESSPAVTNSPMPDELEVLNQARV